MISLDDFVEKTVLLVPVKPFSSKGGSRFYAVKLRGFDAGGIWIEHPELTSILFAAVGVPPSGERKPVFFLPYSQVEQIVDLAVELDAKALGV